MGYRVDNAVIMAAGTSSRFAPLSFERPKALIKVKGEILIERQIRQLKEAGINQIIVVTGYKSEQFTYLEEKFGVILVENKEYLTRNNNGSIYAVRDYLANTYICSADNYFTRNPFEAEVEDAYYSALYAHGETKEWCLKEDEQGYITSVEIGGRDAWYMLGHVFWSREFSESFKHILEEIYEKEETKDLLWESIYMEYLDQLKMKVRHYDNDFIFEFDTLDELREFDESYCKHSGSQILAAVAESLGCREEEIYDIKSFKYPDSTEAAGFRFCYGGRCFEYGYDRKTLVEIKL